MRMWWVRVYTIKYAPWFCCALFLMVILSVLILFVWLNWYMIKLSVIIKVASLAMDYPDISEIKNTAWVTVNNDFLSRVRWFGNDFHEWPLPIRLTSDKKIVIHGNECIILFLTCYFMSWTHKSAKNYYRALVSPLLPRGAFSDRALWRTTIDLWRHANEKYWYCDVIFVYCHCMRKLAQRRSSLVNNSREYRYLATRYSRLSV